VHVLLHEFGLRLDTAFLRMQRPVERLVLVTLRDSWFAGAARGAQAEQTEQAAAEQRQRRRPPGPRRRVRFAP
jgi:hypothetical protein